MYSRRDFLRFMGSGALSVGTLSSLPIMTSCSSSPYSLKGLGQLKPQNQDDVILASGLHYQLLASYGDVINSKGELFGDCNDYIAFLPIAGKKSEAYLWVNHEYINPLFVSGYQSGKRTQKQVDLERKAVGGSLLKIKWEAREGGWRVDANENQFARRVDATTMIPFKAQRKIRGAAQAQGTLANCSGGVTPWGTILTCEENYHDFYGDREHQKDKLKTGKFNWQDVYQNPPEHYGWVVEVDPYSDKIQKLTALGRFAHESATTIKAKDGRVVVYSGDDKKSECIYKFISSRAGSLEEGELFVANTQKGKWISLDRSKQPVLQKHFKDQLEVLTYCRKASRLVGASLEDRPEDIEIQPGTNNVFISLTNNYDRHNWYGSLLKIEEKNNDPLALEFSASTFAMGGSESGFACPDNLVFDLKGNLWMTSDMAGDQMNQGHYAAFKNNGLFYFPLSGPHAGKAFQMASAPMDAEFTGPCFSEDGKTLFLSVQHPGEQSSSLTQLTSRWPAHSGLPKSSVIQISGPLMQQLI